VRRLIVNADDFGITPGVNRAIVEAHQHGIVTSATMMAGARAYDQAAELARSAAQDNAQLSVGCHVVLVDGTPLLPAEQVPSLRESVNGPPQFRTTLNKFALAALAGKLDAREVEAEATAQIQRVQQAGIALSHIDTHKHAHIFPVVLRPLLSAAKASGISAVRNPFEPAFSMHIGQGGWEIRKRRLQMHVLQRFAADFQREVAAHGLRATDGALGVLVTGVLDLNLFIEIASRIPDGTWEFVCHPGYNDRDLDEVRTRLRASREQELQVLTSSEARKVLEQHGVQLISYHEL
jgi:predicted glycoside hydrolase/deacetylase ChbG (UPF0249 family)